jgi:hypothetical protein
MPTPKPKAPTYGELSNIRTKLEMQEKSAKAKFPNDKVKITHTTPDGKKLTLKDVNKQLDKMNPKPLTIKDVAVPVKGLTKATPKPTVKPKMTAAEKTMSKELSSKGMKETAKKQSDAMDKKYPGLYKNGKK